MVQISKEKKRKWIRAGGGSRAEKEEEKGGTVRREKGLWWRQIDWVEEVVFDYFL